MDWWRNGGEAALARLAFQLWSWWATLLAALASLLRLPSATTVTTTAPRSPTYTIHRRIGEGGYSTVYLASTGAEVGAVGAGTDGAGPGGSRRQQVALKLMRDLDAWRHEAAVLHALPPSPYVLECLEASTTRTALGNGPGVGAVEQGVLVFPYYPLGTIADAPRGAREHGVRWVVEACKGLTMLHAHGYAYRDLKPGNILLAGEGPYNSTSSPGTHALLADLGSAESPHTRTIHTRREALELAERWAQICTAPYRAPELFDPRSGTTITPASDVWSVGCCLYYVAYGHDCFDGTLTCALSNLSLPHGDALDGIIRQCLRIEPSERPTLDALIQQLDGLPALELRVEGSVPRPPDSWPG